MIKNNGLRTSTKRFTFKNSYINLLFLIIIFYPAGKHAGAETPTLTDRSHIATIDGKKLFYLDIKTSFDSIHSYLQINKGHASEEQNKAELKKIKHERELQILADKISQIVIQDIIDHLKISASQEEVQKYLNELFPNSQLDATAAALEIRQSTQLILDALEKVERGEESSATAYEKFLTTKITLLEWSIYQDNFKDPKRRKLLEARAKVTAAQLDTAMEANARQVIETEKLLKWVDRAIGESDPRFQEYKLQRENLAKHGAHDTDEETAALKKAQHYLSSARTLWWSNHYKEKVTIEHPLFTEVFGFLRRPSNQTK